MIGSIRESKESLFSYGNEAAVNHRVSLYVAGVCACLLILITIVLVAIPQNLYSANPNGNHTYLNPPQVPPDCEDANANSKTPAASKPPCTIAVVNSSGNCTVTCQGIGNVAAENDVQPGEIIVESIQALYANYSSQCYGSWALEIRSSKFPNFKVEADWFQVEDEDNFPRIAVLEFQECPGLMKIESGALVKFPFGQNLITFTLTRNKKFDELRSEITNGLTSLATLNLRENGVISHVDEDFFAPFNNSLQVLQIQGGFESAHLVAKMIGICQKNFLGRLLLLDLSFNNQGNGLRHLGSHQLTALKKVQSMFLLQSGIEVIDVDAFTPIADRINTLNLADNQLSTLLDGTFDKFLERNGFIDIYLNGNNWKCDCHLQWLQNLFKNGSTLILKDRPLCSSPNSEKGKLLLEADMSSSCPEYAPPQPVNISCGPSSTTSSPFESTSTTPMPNPEFECSNFHHTFRSTSILTSRQVQFEINEQVNDDSQYAQVVIDTRMNEGGPPKTLVWHKEDQPACLRGVSGLVVVTNLTRGMSYVFCLYEGEEIESPSQCQGWTTLPKWEARAWILNEQMPMWVAIFVIVAIVCALVGAGSVIVAFWQKPTLLALNSRVVKVGTTRTEAVIMPKIPKKKAEKKQEKMADDVSIRSNPSYVSIVSTSKISVVAFREWLRKVENGELSPTSITTTENSSNTFGKELGGEKISTTVSTVSSNNCQPQPTFII